MSQFKNVNVVQYTVAKANWEQAKKWYGEILGWPVAWASDEAGWIEWGKDNETHISINRWDGPEPVPAKTKGVIAVLSVDDAYKTAEWLRSKDVKCDDVVKIPGMVTYGTFYDPEGNALQFASNG